MTMDINQALEAVISDDRHLVEQGFDLLSGSKDPAIARKLHNIAESSTGAKRYLARGAINGILANIRAYLPLGDAQEILELIELFGQVRDRESTSLLCNLAMDRSKPADIRLASINSLSQIGEVSVIGSLITLFVEPNQEKRITAALIRLIIIVGLEIHPHDDEEPKAKLFRIVGEENGEKIIQLISNALDDPDHRIRAEAAVFLQIIGFEDVMLRLRNQLQSSKFSERLAAVYTLGFIGTEEALKMLLFSLEDPDERVISMALSRLETVSFPDQIMAQAGIERLLSLISSRKEDDEIKNIATGLLDQHFPSSFGDLFFEIFRKNKDGDNPSTACAAGLRLKKWDALDREISVELAGLLTECGQYDQAMETIRWHIEYFGEFGEKILNCAMITAEAGGDPSIIVSALLALVNRGLKPDLIAKFLESGVIRKLENLQIKLWLVEIGALAARCRRSSPGVSRNALMIRFEELARDIMNTMPEGEKAGEILFVLEEMLVNRLSFLKERDFQESMMSLMSLASALYQAAQKAGLDSLGLQASEMLMQFEAVAGVMARGADAPILPFLSVQEKDARSLVSLSALADSRLHLLAGVAARKIDDIQTAMIHFDVASRLDPYCIELHEILVDIYSRLGLRGRMLAELEITGDLLSENNEEQKALEYYIRAYRLDPKNEYLKEKLSSLNPDYIKALSPFSELFPQIEISPVPLDIKALEGKNEDIVEGENKASRYSPGKLVKKEEEISVDLAEDKNNASAQFPGKLAKKEEEISVDLAEDKNNASAQFSGKLAKKEEIGAEYDPDIDEKFRNIKAFLESGDLEGAYQEFVENLLIFALDIYIMRNIAKEFLKGSRADLAVNMCQKAVESRRYDPDMHILLWETMLGAGDLAGALNFVESSLIKYSDSVLYEEFLANIRDELTVQIRGFNYQKMAQLLKIQEKIAPETTEIERIKADISQKKQIFDRHKSSIIRGEELIETGDLTQALLHFDKMADYSHDEARIARYGLERIFAEKPDPAIRFSIAKAMATLGEWDLALRNLRGSEQIGTLYEANILYVKIMIYKGQLEVALELLRTIIPPSKEEKEICGDYCFEIGALFEKNNNKEKAIKAYRACLNFSPERDDAKQRIKRLGE